MFLPHPHICLLKWEVLVKLFLWAAISGGHIEAAEKRTEIQDEAIFCLLGLRFPVTQAPLLNAEAEVIKKAHVCPGLKPHKHGAVKMPMMGHLNKLGGSKAESEAHATHLK